MKPPSFEEYCKRSNTSIACTSKACTIIPPNLGIKRPKFRLLNQLETATVLDIHNVYRSELAFGYHLKSYYIPSIANMNVLSYDKEAEFLAICSLYNTESKEPLNGVQEGRADMYGKNVFTSKINSLDHHWRSRLLRKATGFWFQQVKYLNEKQVQVAIDHYEKDKIVMQENKKANVECFTQLSWADTKFVGCAITYTGMGPTWAAVLVCVYYPSGNVEGGSMLRAGSPGRGCKKKNSIFKSLCGYIRFSKHDKFVSPLQEMFPRAKDKCRRHLMDNSILYLLLTVIYLSMK
ncbi:PREDICTED: venom allergen 5-like [Nicrophorus vespilloides]|uniref:Venom allergen 5-like n=1 Tax=Nicrophorus vespilloides TaxID=110193 RepID=A0ABM1MT60_NICVS|nr:PREDICTED: venom allergen 5-like [Nicrophorus vespilloides]